jgi:glycosyltransferase involved in cell wall biosynthesis
MSLSATLTISSGESRMTNGAARRLTAHANVSSGSKRRRVLYLTYDGLTDQLGRSQILPYLEGLAAKGHDITIISCEKPDRLRADGERVRTICKQAGIGWQPLRYHKRPPVLSSIIDVLQMKRLAIELQRREPFDLVHCRSYMAALIGHSLKRRYGVPFLFDMRGFWADERIERGFWPKNNPVFRLAYRYFKNWEVHFFRDADAVVSLTDSARQEIESWPDSRRARGPISVIPCSVDMELFDPADGRARAAGRKRFALSGDRRVLLYVGSVGPGYVVDAMFGLFRALREIHPGARYLFVSSQGEAEILALAKGYGIEPDEMIVVAGKREEMPALIATGDIGVSIIEPTYAAKATCPTKVGEMLAMGVPVIANSGVGDMAELIGGTGAGAILERFDDASFAAAIAKVEDARLSREQIRAVACKSMALEDGIERYEAIYRSMGS